MRYRFLYLLIILPSILLAQSKITALQCEYMIKPSGIDMQNPRLMWKYESDSYLKQKSYRILVATSKEKLSAAKADVWNSGFIKSQDQLVYYSGEELTSDQTYYWLIQAKTSEGKISSNITHFQTGKFHKSDWKANWITDSHDKSFEPSPRFRKEFETNKKITSAKCYISGLGYYQLSINGKKINQNHLDPGFTDYGKRVLYNSIDITKHLKQGKNAIGVELGNGWFNEQTPTVWNFDIAPWRKRPQLLCEIKITYNDGSTKVIATDTTWKTNTGPLLFDNIHVGVIYDARLEQSGWNTINYNDKNWNNAKITQEPSTIIESQKMALISSEEILEPIAVQQLNDTSLVFDMGINTAGVVELNIEGKKGMEVKLKHGEMLLEDGSVDQRNIDMHLRPRNEKERIQTDTYILKGDGVETYTPSFTYHGFRYVQVSSKDPVSAQNVYLKTIKLHSNVESIGSFKTSNETLNSIFEICKNSYLSNLFSIPTDCPTREKNGWMADGFMVQEAGMLNYDSRNIYAKWIKDMVDAQQENGNMPGIVPTSHHWDSNWAGPIWDAAIFIVPDLLYQYSGDLESIKTIYPSAKKYLKYLESQENEMGIIDFGLGDWLFYKAETSTPFMVTAYYYYDNVLMAKMARLLGKNEEAKKYDEKAAVLKERINKIFFDNENLTYANQTQLSYALPLYMDIAPEAYKNQLAEKLNLQLKNNDYFLDFGFIGSLIVPEVLSNYGYQESVYKMVAKEEMPSWGYWIKEHNASSLFETWDIKRRIFDASLNHPSMGAIAAWMYKSLAGIKLDKNETSFKKIIIEPSFIEDLDFVDASYNSLYGKIKVKWTKENNNVKLEIEIPPTATAQLKLPQKSHNIKGGEHQFEFQL